MSSDLLHELANAAKSVARVNNEIADVPGPGDYVHISDEVAREALEDELVALLERIASEPSKALDDLKMAGVWQRIDEATGRRAR